MFPGLQPSILGADRRSASAHRHAFRSFAFVRVGATDRRESLGTVSFAQSTPLRTGWTPFLRELWATLKPDAIVFVKDEQDVEDDAVRLLGADAWSVPGVRGVFLRRGE